MLPDRGTEYCGTHERHPCELYLAVNDIEHTRTRIKRPQTNRTCERFHNRPQRVLPCRVSPDAFSEPGGAQEKRIA